MDDVRHLLVEQRIRRVPVQSGARLAGIVNRGDVVALQTTEWVRRHESGPACLSCAGCRGDSIAGGCRGGAAEVKISLTDLLVKASATALAAHPEVNVSWDQTRILLLHHVSIGVAVAIDDGHEHAGSLRTTSLAAPIPSATWACTASASSPP